MKKISVWDLQTRIFHWSLVIFTLCTIITADFLSFFGIDLVNKDTWLSFHICTGVSVGILLLFRIFWGLTGPQYSRFSALHLKSSELVLYFKSVMKNQKTDYTGHNPAASWSALCIIALGLFAVLSGVIVFGIDEGRGIFRSLYLDYYSNSDQLKLLHLIISYLMLGVILGHICGVFNETIRHKTGIITAMFTGKKLSAEPEGPLLSAPPFRLISYLWVISPLGVILYLPGSLESNPPVKLAIPPVYLKECGSCHMAFPPNSLPVGSWKKMIAGLHDHFGEDASISNTAKQEVESFLVKNAAETSREEASIKFLRSISKDNPPVRITDIPYWREKHKMINQEIYQRNSIKSKINCTACHRLAEYGSFEDNDIRIPKN